GCFGQSLPFCFRKARQLVLPGSLNKKETTMNSMYVKRKMSLRLITVAIGALAINASVHAQHQLAASYRLVVGEAVERSLAQLKADELLLAPIEGKAREFRPSMDPKEYAAAKASLAAKGIATSKLVAPVSPNAPVALA